MKRSLLVLAAVITFPFACVAFVACDMLHTGDKSDASPAATAPAVSALVAPTAAPVAPGVVATATSREREEPGHEREHGAPHAPGQPVASGSAATPPPLTFPTAMPSGFPTALPSGFPTALPSNFPKTLPSGFPTALPSGFPTAFPTASAGK